MSNTAGKTHTAPSFCLASSSPRRRQLLELLGIGFMVLPADVCERRHGAESPDDYVLRLATAKATAVAAAPASASLPVLGADTCVVIDDEILGKPQDSAAATATLRHLRDRTHDVLTAVALRHQENLYTAVSRSRVTFAPMSDTEIQRYVDSGEPDGKAGAYAIQGRAAAFITHLEGSYTGVVGLPLYDAVQLLQRVGISV